MSEGRTSCNEKRKPKSIDDIFDIRIPEEELSRIRFEKDKKARTMQKITRLESRPSTLSYPRISFDRINFSIISNDIFKYLYPDESDEKYKVLKKEIIENGYGSIDIELPKAIDKSYRSDVFKRYSDYFGQNMVDHKGHTSGLKVSLVDFEGESIAWITISMRAPFLAVCYCNVQKLYRLKYGLPKPIDAYHDTNYLPLGLDDIDNILDEFVEIYLEIKVKFERAYVNLIKQWFNYDIDSADVIPSVVEIPLEYLGKEVAEYSWLSDVVNCEEVVKRNGATNTHYFNKKAKYLMIQMKLYQKAPGIARLELTAHKQFASHYLNSEEPEILKDRLGMLIEDILGEYGLSLYEIKPVELSHSELLTQFANSFGLLPEVLSTLLYSDLAIFNAREDNQPLKKKLVRKGLLVKEKDLSCKRGKKKSKNGIYVPTDALKFLRMALGKYFLCEHCGNLMTEHDGRRYTCAFCGFSKYYG